MAESEWPVAGALSQIRNAISPQKPEPLTEDLSSDAAACKKIEDPQHDSDDKNKKEQLALSWKR